MSVKDELHAEAEAEIEIMLHRIDGVQLYLNLLLEQSDKELLKALMLAAYIRGHTMGIRWVADQLDKDLLTLRRDDSPPL